jgi:lipoprotein signal peptidase
MGLVLAGTLGNLYDRLVFQQVRDFIDVYLRPIRYHYPTFNVADSLICVGVGILAWYFTFGARSAGAPEARSRASEDGKAGPP